MYLHLEIIVVKLAARLIDNPAGVSVQRHPIVRLADHPPGTISQSGSKAAWKRTGLTICAVVRGHGDSCPRLCIGSYSWAAHITPEIQKASAGIEG
jgi:hypothetical protein